MEDGLGHAHFTSRTPELFHRNFDYSSCEVASIGVTRNGVVTLDRPPRRGRSFHFFLCQGSASQLASSDALNVVQIPVGDQPSDIERQIRNLVLDYISKPNWYVAEPRRT